MSQLHCCSALGKENISFILALEKPLSNDTSLVLIAKICRIISLMKKEIWFSLELLTYYGYINLFVAVEKMYQELGL